MSSALDMSRRMKSAGVRLGAWLLGGLALAFYVGFIALTYFRSHH